MFPFNKPETKQNPRTAFGDALAKALADARKAGLTPDYLAGRLETYAQNFRMQAHHDSERRHSPSGITGEAVNESWAVAEKARLIKAGEWPK